MKVGRNDPCSCGSGRKYKQCCARTQVKRERLRDSLSKGLFYLLVGPVALAFLAVVAFSALRTRDGGDEPQKVWSAAHNHWHYRLPDGNEIEARPGLVWSPEQGRFVEAEPLTEGARKHVKSSLDQHLRDAEEVLDE